MAMQIKGVLISFLALQSLILLLCMHQSMVHSLPLSTNLRWVVDEATGRRVKLHCVNWAAHMEPMLAEGLHLRPLHSIASTIVSLGFNCVRLTWATHMLTQQRYAATTAIDSLVSLNLAEAAACVAQRNPSIAGMTLVEAYEAVVDALGAAGLMVVLDNHVSRPMWCCADDDGNSFFGDLYFDTEEWLQGLAMVAHRFRRRPHVVGMSLRNELRGPHQRMSSWYKNIKRGAMTIHRANPNLLIIISGLNYGTDLSFLQDIPLDLNQLDKKLVYEAHWYSFSLGRRLDWERENPGRICASAIRSFEKKVGFLIDEKLPLFLSEFGVDQRGMNRADNRFLPCFLAYAAEKDLDWAMWALQGSYYRRNGKTGFEETYGVLDSMWMAPKNTNFNQRFRLLHELLQDGASSSSSSYLILYHPQSGYCIEAEEGSGRVVLGDCARRSKWSYQGDGSPIKMMGSELCLKMGSRRVSLSSECSDEASQWWKLPRGKLQIGVRNLEGMLHCLETSNWPNSNYTQLVGGNCLCLNQDEPCDQNPQVQWFKFIPSNNAQY